MVGHLGDYLGAVGDVILGLPRHDVFAVAGLEESLVEVGLFSVQLGDVGLIGSFEPKGHHVTHLEDRLQVQLDPDLLFLPLGRQELFAELGQRLFPLL